MSELEKLITGKLFRYEDRFEGRENSVLYLLLNVRDNTDNVLYTIKINGENQVLRSMYDTLKHACQNTREPTVSIPLGEVIDEKTAFYLANGPLRILDN